jgi:hypothetical protein
MSAYTFTTSPTPQPYSPVNYTEKLTDDETYAIHSWIDTIVLSRPKRNIARDFNDGVLLAEVIAAYIPNLVELHNYPAASSLKQKIYNYETLNNRVLKKLGYNITRQHIEDIANCKAGAIEIVLNTIQYKIAKYREKKSGFGSTVSSTSSDNNKFERGNGSPSSIITSPFKHGHDNNMDMTIMENTMIDVTNILKSPSPSPTLPKTKNILVSANNVDMEILLEKEEEIRELRDTIEILEFKIGKLEQLVRLKDSEIQNLRFPK